MVMTSSSGSDVNKDGVKDELNSSSNGSLLKRTDVFTTIRKKHIFNLKSQNKYKLSLLHRV